MAQVRLAIDIGGTFTDVVLDTGDGRVDTTKVLTTPKAPEDGALTGMMVVLQAAGLKPADVDLILHGTTLATNALIERKGAKTALIATEGFRDVLAIGYEDRYDQYDIGIVKPAPLIDRALRFTVPERVAVDGAVLKPLDEAAVAALVPQIEAAGVEAVAVALIHAYAAPAHEERIGAILAEALPGVSVSLSSAVSPEAREFERTMTTAVNAYVQPLMAGYLGRFQTRLAEEGFAAPVLLMTSGGGLTTIETARQFPVRLVESGPAGGAILAAEVARACGEDKVLSFDMGGTTAKICLIDAGTPNTARVFEVDRQSRFTKGSGLPIRIPVIEMIEIGAGGGSIAKVDAMKRIAVGPQSAGSDPGPVAYGRGGTAPTVTDGDLTLGRLDPDDFAGGRIKLDAAASAAAIAKAVGEPMGLSPRFAAFGIAEIVDENMANAARVHAVENGADVASRTLIAFGGAAPLHAGRLAQKLGIDKVIVPAHAGVGSAVGFLYAPVSFEVVRSAFVPLDGMDREAVAAMYAEMDAVVRPVVTAAVAESEVTPTRTAYLRYMGQGHEVPVEVPADFDPEALKTAFEAAYRALFGRTIAGAAVEAMSWSLALAAPAKAERMTERATGTIEPQTRTLFDPDGETTVEVRAFPRAALADGTEVPGPALVTEAATTTVVPKGYTAALDGDGHLILTRQPQAQEIAA
ncbi:hydantoinase/oxoprolinase family protein [Acuticoccus sp. I52.16.1]|uniref:hydantoinase/oxoprolinase family protein n=1 Tax=Acuticoccus sp. I52.16.1 TaxID=2928472 RepID=UPI001FD37CBC|nr:hydantoinase/oxoprolinase family protein [Acuticoccus sp. I52.16.1]UOM34829.1 hydantoinase/oxoprolinase family protein [Acuticoccus sp. I52.16.1]